MRTIIFITAVFIAACNHDFVPQWDGAVLNDTIHCAKIPCKVGIWTYVIDSITHDSTTFECIYADIVGCNFNPCDTMDCNDNDRCTIDICVQHAGYATCGHRPGACNPCDTLICDDNSVCTMDTCFSASGCYHLAKICPDDGDGCTANICHPITGCYYEQPEGFCDDYNACTIDTCIGFPGGWNCVRTPVSCNDNNPCTIDSCYNTESDEPQCLNRDTCITCAFDTIINPTLNDYCKVIVCVDGDEYATVRACDDGIPCTDNFCNAIIGCYNPPKDCNDGTGIPYVCNPQTGLCEYGALKMGNPVLFPTMILDITGRRMVRDIDDLPAGLYFNIYTGKKFMVVR